MTERRIAPGGSASVFVLHEVLACATVIVLGRGPAFRPTENTPR